MFMFLFYSTILKDAAACLTATFSGSRPYDRTAVPVLPLHPFSPPTCLLRPPPPWLPTPFILPCESDTATNPSPQEARLPSHSRVSVAVLLRPVRVDVGGLDKSKKNTAGHARTYFCRRRGRALGQSS